MTARPADQVWRNTLALLPPGWAWPRDTASNTAQLFRAPATVLADFEARADALQNQTNPRRAAELLPDYERVRGPDPCTRDASTLSLDERQRIALQRWTGRGGQSVAYFVALAASLGVAITIQEQMVSECGVSVCGDDLAREGEQFIWLITLPTERLIDAFCGASECGDALGSFTASTVECPIRQQAPAHTVPVFSYTAGI